MSDTETLYVVVKNTGVFVDDFGDSVRRETIMFARSDKSQSEQDVKWLTANASTLPDYGRDWIDQGDITHISYRVVEMKLFHSGDTKDIVNE